MNELTPLSIIFLENNIVTQMLKKISQYYGIRILEAVYRGRVYRNIRETVPTLRQEVSSVLAAQGTRRRREEEEEEEDNAAA
jgi:hypothetical protein